MFVVGNRELTVAFCALAFSVLLSPFLAQDEAPLKCLHIDRTNALTAAVLTNRIAEMKSVLKLNDRQVAKLTVAGKRIASDQSRPIDDLSKVPNQKYMLGNPLTSKFWLTVRNKVLTEDQTTLLLEHDRVVEANSLATAINSKEALESPVEMTKFYLARWKRDARLSDQQMEDIKPLLKNFLGQEGVDTMDSRGFVSDLEKSKVLTESQLLLFKSPLGVGHGPIWNEVWKEGQCSACHNN